MNRREFLKLATTGAGALALSRLPGTSAAWDAAASAGAVRPPNIILMLVDDFGYANPSFQGGDIPTPNIDAIAAQGIRAQAGYCSGPVCAPTRAGVLTGRYQQRYGVDQNPPDPTPWGWGIPRTEMVIAEYLKPAGYATGLVGKWHTGFGPGLKPTERGFDEFFGFLGGGHPYYSGTKQVPGELLRGTTPVSETGYLTTVLGREANSFIQRHQAQPFFLFFCPNAVHTPLQAPSNYLQHFAAVRNETRRAHMAMTAALDDVVGGIMTTLRDTGLDSSTLVIFLSDNGGATMLSTSRNDPFRGEKHMLYEGGIRVPFLFRWPGVLAADRTYPHPISSLDLLPTILAAAGVSQQPANLDGVNLLPYLGGTSFTAAAQPPVTEMGSARYLPIVRKKMTGPPHQNLFWHYRNQWAVRSGDWKLIQPSALPTLELYNLAEDPSETNNVYHQHQDQAQAIQQLYQEWAAQL